MNKFPKPSGKSREAAKPAAKPIEKEAPQNTHAVRETVESIVIAFILAFLFRTFEAEAFVIPTGSMAPTLMGRHKDVDCVKCGHRYRVTDSDDEEAYRELIAKSKSQAEIEDYRQRISDMQVVGGVCPVCRYPMPFTPELNSGTSPIEPQVTYNGDRILVNKYLYALTDPKRWDVVVFHFPGDAEINYIKRLVGLPGETLRVFQGDLHIGPPGAKNDDPFKIARKPADKFLAVRQLVHDTDYDAAELYEAGWPLRWKAESPTGADGWKTDATIEGDDVQQKFTVDRMSGGDAWLRYHHTVPNQNVWRQLDTLRQTDPKAKFSDEELNNWPAELVTDFNAYNTRIQRGNLKERNGFWPEASRLGNHWVGDLMVEADVTVTDAKGELLLDLVEAGKHFKCRIDLATGQATLGIEGVDDFAPTGTTPAFEPGEYRVAFANVDDQLMLWASKKTLGSTTFNLEPKQIDFDDETTYDATKVFGPQEAGVALRPQTSNSDRGDLAPAGIGARGGKLTVTRLQLWRDIYYIADKAPHAQNEPISDFTRLTDTMKAQVRSDPQMWDEFTRRRHVDFPLADDQFFVMGDNSPESSDARLWSEPRNNGQPSGAYLERKQLIGKAIFVYWPHSWLPIMGWGIVPNVKDMRLVK